MAVYSMKLLNIIGDLEHADEVAQLLGKCGVFHPDDAQEFYSKTSKFIPLSTRNDNENLLERLRIIMSETKITPKIIDHSQYDDAQDITFEDVVNDLESEIQSIIDEKNSTKDKIAKCKQNIDLMTHFTGLDANINSILDCEYVIPHFGRLPKDNFQKLSRYNNDPYIKFITSSKTSEYYWGMYFSPVQKSSEVDRIFSSLYFHEIQIDRFDGLPSDYVEQEKNKLKVYENKINELDESILTWGKNNDTRVLSIFSKLCELNTYSIIKTKSYKYNESFITVGWVPSEYAGQIDKQLRQINSVEVTITDAKDETMHSPPVKLKNKFFSKPFEFYTDMYGLPNYDEIDPSTFIAITYSILFGIMFADLGHGLALLIAAIIMYKCFKMPLGRLLIPCAISSCIFGVVFGSVFGFEDALDPFYQKVFKLESKPIEVLDSNSITYIIYAAIGIGVLLVILAMFLNICACLRKHDIVEALCGANGLAGLVFYSSLAIGLGSQLILGKPIMNTVYICLLIVLPLIVIFFKDPLKKIAKHDSNIFEEGVGSFIAVSFFELFETVLSYVTNTMSFLRVGAFVLVHAGMMLVVFAIAEMCSPIGYVLVMIIGNAIVIALEALLVGIQVLRLQYYEMFSKFYTGDGRKYEPVNINNMYN